MDTPTPPNRPLPYRLASAFGERPIDWLWLYRLAFGNVSLLVGDPGLGKSLLTLDLCARLSTGRPMPDGAPSPGPLTSVVLNAEDDVATTTRPRLNAMGADLDRVVLFDRDDLAAWDPPFLIPSSVGLLEEAIARSGARLVVIDPLTHYLDPGVNIASDPAVRRALRPLSRLAKQYRCVILMNLHLNKDGGSRSLYRGAGSIAFVAASRSAWLAARDPDQPHRCALAQVKNNLAAPQPALAYEVQDPKGPTPTLAWSRGAVPWTADQLLGQARPPAVGKRQRAGKFLLSVLADGPLTTRDLWARAEPLGLSGRTLRRAREDVQVRTVRVQVNGARRNYWLLPGQELPAGVTPVENRIDLEELLAPIREQFPPRTPLDDRDI